MDERKDEFMVARGKIDRIVGIKHLFLDGDDDMDVTIAQGDDKKIAGKYIDIEKLGYDQKARKTIRKSTIHSNSAFEENK